MEYSTPLKRIGVIGDIHAEDHYLQVALDFFEKLNLDLVMAVGDIADGPGSVDNCCELLRKHNVATVKGNHERWLIGGAMRELTNATSIDTITPENRKFLSNLPLTKEYDTVAGRLLLCHGLGEYDMGGVLPGDGDDVLATNLALRHAIKAQYRFVINGHTHNRMVRRFDHMTIINAGTLLRYRQPCFLTVDFASEVVQFFDFDESGIASQGERAVLT